MKKKSGRNYDNFGMPELNMPFIPDLSEFINPKMPKRNNLESGVDRVVNATKLNYDYDERKSSRPQRLRRKANLFERGERLKNGEAPLNEYEAYQFNNQRDYFGGNNIF